MPSVESLSKSTNISQIVNSHYGAKNEHAKISSGCKVVTIFGLEGVGHHGIAPIIMSAANQSKDFVVGSLTTTIHGAHGIESIIHPPRIVEAMSKGDFLLLDKEYAQLNEACKKAGVICVFRPGSGASFPASRSPFTSKLKVQKRWESRHMQYLKTHGHPIHVQKFHKAISAHCEVKILVLHRNLVDSVWAHPTWDTGIVGHAQVLQMFMKYMSENLENIPKDDWRRFNYEDMWRSDNTQVLKALGEFLGWDIDWASILAHSRFKFDSSKPLIDCQSLHVLINMEKAMKWGVVADPNQHVMKLPMTNAFNSPKINALKRKCPQIRNN
eukprot:CAMPEP_0196580870 /NCGR_PEP_ID=MMETSP1081-20130531/31132_1 /TAXON_ID=36882 /ORGANISM="Pyramimonas amylifera, Strain CCMP720" /LENGTH=326 /DNA_ID=CAMNT_0041900885 /DNA_START=41 /DNA_END=1021 /DNA_ORIENTATION=+